MSRTPGLRKFVGPPGAAAPAAAPAPGPAARPAPPERQAAAAAPAGQADAPEERCEFCATGIPATHGHVADLEKSSLACACRACYLLFTQAAPGRGGDAPGRGGDPPAAPASGSPQGSPLPGPAPRRGSARYRSVPDRYQRDSSRPMSAAEWDELQIPVGLAFFLYSSERGAVAGFYPSPAGATECTLDLAAWARLAAAHPLLATAEPDVEAVLLCREGRAAEAEYFIVPIDVCYELAGRMRMLWKGFDGGSEARDSIEEFLAGVRKRAREAPAGLGERTPAGPRPAASPASQQDAGRG